MSLIKEYRDLLWESDALFNQTMERSGISSNRYMTLFCIAEGIDTQADICKRLHIPKQTLNSVIHTLLKQGLISVDAASCDGRSKKLALTPEGQDMYLEKVAPTELLEEAAFCMLSDDEQRTLCDIMRKFNGFIKQKTTEYQVNNGEN